MTPSLKEINKQIQGIQYKSVNLKSFTFVDDATFLAKNTNDIAIVFRDLQEYGLASGININKQKHKC